jgi:arylsulfatase A-like enzyme
LPEPRATDTARDLERRRARLVVCLALLLAASACTQQTEQPPNFVVLLADDLGYGDLSSYGHPTISTPRIDRMAEEGLRLTSFYVTAPICTPTRISLLTGRYPMRSGLHRVIFPPDEAGIPSSEITLAEGLKNHGYRTAMIGKWHLGHADESLLPTRHGFDQYFGLLYSNDMTPPWMETSEPLRLYRDLEPIPEPVDQATLTVRYTEEAVRFIRSARDGPFFLYLAYTMPHFPLHTAERFRGTSARGLYGDVVAGIDWSVSRILEVLREQGLEDNTLVIFTSDNGPSTGLELDGGSAGPLRGGKSTSWEGGFRVPFIARWPGHIPAGGVSAEVATILDLFPTLLGLAGAQLPDDRPLDGRDIMGLLEGQDGSPSEAFYYFLGPVLEAARVGPWKLRRGTVGYQLLPTMPRIIQQSGEQGRSFTTTPFFADLEIELYNLELDPSERFNVAADHPQIVEELGRRMEAFAADLEPGPALLGWPIPGVRIGAETEE